MSNPFSYSGIVSDIAFCNREKEQKNLIDLIKNSQNIILYSHRKSGKSSLIYKVFQRLKIEEPVIKSIYIDLYGTLKEQNFINALFGGLTQIEPHYKKLIKSIPGLKLIGSVDPLTNTPTLSLTTDPIERVTLLEKAMKILESYSQKNRIVVAFDEFQEVAGYSEKGFEKRLRSYIQRHNKISYIYSGSQTHILSEMFNSAKRAFYQSAQSFPLETIKLEHYILWVQKLFKQKKKDFSTQLVENIVKRCDFQPMYIQQFLYILWRYRNITLDKINATENQIILSHRNEYIGIFNTLTINQKKALKLIAITNGKAIYQTDILNKIGFKNNSLLSRAIESLMEKELIFKNGKYKMQDIMFKKWILKIPF